MKNPMRIRLLAMLGSLAFAASVQAAICKNPVTGALAPCHTRGAVRIPTRPARACVSGIQCGARCLPAGRLCRRAG